MDETGATGTKVPQPGTFPATCGTPQRPASKNTAVYVTGLPADISLPEMTAHFSRCGIIMDDMVTGQPRIKLYATDGTESVLKGDALVIYLREESVRLAVQILDESDIRPGQRIRVQEASFDRNGGAETAPTGKRSRADREAWRKHLRKMHKKLEWYDVAGEEEARLARFAKIVVLRHMYTVTDLEDDPLAFPVALADEIREECEERIDGAVCSVQLVEELAMDGVCTVKFRRDADAHAAVRLMHGRWFDGRRVEASIYDGSFPLPKAKRPTFMTSEQREDEERLAAFSEWIERDERDGRACDTDERDDDTDERDDGTDESGNDTDESGSDTSKRDSDTDGDGEKNTSEDDK